MSRIVRYITLHEPFGSLVAIGAKHHETRGRRSLHVGPVVVIAGKAWSERQKTLWDEYAALLEANGRPPLPYAPRLGKAVCVVDQRSCTPTIQATPVDELDRTFGDWSPGRYAYRWTNVRAFAEPFSYPGCQGMRPAPDDLIAEVLSRATFEMSPEPYMPLFAGISDE